MKISQLSKMSSNELETRLDKLTLELSEVRFDIKVGQETDFSTVSKKRKEIARIKTILNEAKHGIRKLDESKAKTSTDKETKKKVEKVEKVEKEDKEVKKEKKSKKEDTKKTNKKTKK